MQIYSSRASEELYNEDFWLRAQSFSKRGKRDAKQPAKVRRRQLRPSLLLALLSIKFIVLVSGSKTNIVKDYSFRRIRGGEDDAPERKIWGLFQFKNELLSEVDAEDPYRGGALVVMNQRTLPDLESLQEVAAPALLLSTPVRNESKAEETEKQDSIWWSSAWSSQLPVDEENDVAGEAESETSGDGDELRLDELSSELERVTTSDSTLSTTEISSDEVTEQSKWEEDLHDGDSSDIEEYTRRVYADTPTGPGASNNETTKVVEQEEVADSPFISSGWWASIDTAVTFGYADTHPEWRVSRRLRTVRKKAANITGIHGILSGKGRNGTVARAGPNATQVLRRERSRSNETESFSERSQVRGRRRRLFGFRRRRRREDRKQQPVVANHKSADEERDELERKARVQEIDRLISQSQQRLQALAAEKDVLQRRPNPLWTYSVPRSGHREKANATRRFIFPPQDLVEEYLEVLFVSGRLQKLNHTDLWRKDALEDDELDDDDFLQTHKSEDKKSKKNGSNGNADGNWFLRYSLGEKIGEAAEQAAYKGVAAATMSALARALSSLHGINIMTHSDIRLFMEQTPELPPLSTFAGHKHATYAQDTLRDVIQRGSSRAKKRRKFRRRGRHDDFVQRDAVAETLLSHCQISAPLLQLFPLAWQRSMVANIVTLVTAILSDFFDGLHFQILGHRLSFAFTPVSEEGLVRSSFGGAYERHRPNPEEFEAAIRATAEDLAVELNFLDKWHERALGSGVLRTQIANLIARLVLTLVDDVLKGAQMDLWTLQAGGPKLVAGVEFRTGPGYMTENTTSINADQATQ